MYACRQRGDDLRAFLRASARGFAWAAQRPELAAGLLVQHSGPCGTALHDLEMVLESQYEMSQVVSPKSCKAGAPYALKHTGLALLSSAAAEFACAQGVYVQSEKACGCCPALARALAAHGRMKQWHSLYHHCGSSAMLTACVHFACKYGTAGA